MDDGFRGEEVVVDSRRGERRDVGVLDCRAVEDALPHRLDILADEHRRQLVAIGEGIAAYRRHLVWDDYRLQAGAGEGCRIDCRYRERQPHGHQLLDVLECRGGDGLNACPLDVDGLEVLLAYQLLHVGKVIRVDGPADNQLDDLVVLQLSLESARRSQLDVNGAATSPGHLAIRTVGIVRVDGEVVAHAGRDADVLCVGSILYRVVGVEHEEAQAALAFHRIEAVGPEIDVIRRLASALPVGGELPKVAALAHLVRTVALLACRLQESRGENVVHTVFHKDYLTILDRILRNLILCRSDAGLRHCYGMVAVVLNLAPRLNGLEESPNGEEVGQVLLSHLAHLADKLQATVVVVRRIVKRQRVVAECLEELRIERGVLLPKVVVEIEVPIHAQTAVDVSVIERLAARKLVHDGGQSGAARRVQAVEIAHQVGEDVVRSLGAALHIDSPLVVVPALVAGAPVVHLRVKRIQAVLDAVQTVERYSVAARVGVTRVLRLALDGEVRIVIIKRINGFAARQIPGVTGLLTCGDGLRHAHQVLLPYGHAVVPTDALVHAIRKDGLVAHGLQVEE